MGQKQPGDTNLTARHPELHAGPVSTDIYWKPELYELELERIFKKTWHYVGREEQLLSAGEFFVKELPTFDFSIIVVRGRDKKVRAFMNACPHRGNQVELAECGKRSAFTCKFHAWKYDLEGRLASVPDEGGFPLLDKSEVSLKELHCESWQGFLFVNIQDRPNQTLKEYVGEQGADLDGYPFSSGTSRFQFSGVVKTNWKFLVDSFCETYHVPFLHSRSIRHTMAGPDNPHGRAVDVRLKGDHRTTSVWASLDYDPQPVQKLAANAAATSITSAVATTQELPKGLNQTRAENWAIDVTVFFPGLVCVINPGMYFTHQMWPLGPDRTKWEMTGYLRPATNAAERFGQEHAIAELRDAVLEDANTLERMTSNVATGLIKEFHFHDHELSLRYQHHTVCKYLGL